MYRKLVISLAALLAMLGLGTGAKANVPMEVKGKIMQIDESTPLVFSQQPTSEGANLLAGHYSHSSHGSHGSHGSHSSHYSHQSGY